MKLKTTPLQGLWILFGTQLLFVICLLIPLIQFQMITSHFIERNQQDTSKVLAVRDLIVKEQDVEKLRTCALESLDLTVVGAKTIQTVQLNDFRTFASLCLGLVFWTVWLGVCAFQLQRESQKKPPP